MPKRGEGGNPDVVEKKEKKPTCSRSSSSAPAPNKPNKSLTPRNEIDEIFAAAGKKRKKPDNDKEKQPRKKDPAVKDFGKRVSKISARDKSGLKKNDEISKKETRRPRKRTGDGLAIYTEEELGMENPNAGGTPLCPFDCECCF